MTEPYAVPRAEGLPGRRLGGAGADRDGRLRQRVRGPQGRQGDADGLPRTAALKFLPTGTGTPRQLTHLRELVEREVELHRRLRRPRLVRMYQTLVVDDPARPALDGATVLVLEKAEGSLSALLVRVAAPGRRARAGRPGVRGPGPATSRRVGARRPETGQRAADEGRFGPARRTSTWPPNWRAPTLTPPPSPPPTTPPPELLWSEIGERGRRIQALRRRLGLRRPRPPRPHRLLPRCPAAPGGPPRRRGRLQRAAPRSCVCRPRCPRRGGRSCARA
ncbi:hypothetical protein LV779_23265 [Streptomyces thinghirensis]|nr:hypothetical protein [Streptomyces thinghirensis]